MEIISKFLTPGVLWFVFFLVSAFVFLVGVTLSYHWREYATDAHKTKTFYRVYVVVTSLFLVIMAISILLYSYGS